MRTQVRIFENTSTVELEKEMNEFLNGISTPNKFNNEL
ncbi:hypothetical protein SAMN05428987_2276 [Paenibacillus sp. CF095]|nr:hypothetical protein SAMN05428987_2276 [Paenibacillus sp. CF095]